MKKCIIVVVSFLLSFFLVLTGLRPTQYEIAPGKAAPADIYANREIVDEVTTEKRRAEAEENLTKQYDIFPEITEESMQKLRNILSFAERQRLAIPHDRETAVQGIDISALLSMEDAAFSAFSSAVLSAQATLLEEGVADKNVALEAIEEMLSSHTRHVDTALSLLSSTLSENKFYNEEKTEEARKALRDSVEPVTYKANQVIVRKGDIVTQAQNDILISLGMVKDAGARADGRSIFGSLLLLIAAYGVLYVYLRRYAHETLKSDGQLLMVSIIFVLTVLLSSAGISKLVSPYILPIVAGTALLAILVEIRFAITYHVVISILSSLIFGGDLYLLSCLLISGILSAFIFTRPGHRHALVLSAGLQVALQFVLYFTIGILEGLEIRAALFRGLYGFGAGAISSVLIIGTLPFWEYAFDVTTPFKLLELSNPDQPLLRRLLTEAPGTYHHSLLVGNLAEVAAEAVGANALLARTGAYYHDIGKLRRPQYFKENQYAENPHDKMDPALSASKILPHPKDGAELARQHRLPGAIRGIISAHHGTSLLAFFYHKAKIENEGEVNEEKFRYRGPRPRTREEAIVMLADCVEAAVRSLENKDEPSIRAMVQKLLQEKLADGQMGDSGLTLRDMETIESAFVHVFCGYFHSRIKYPQNP